MKKTFKVVVDCDDVLFDCNGYAVTKLNREKEYAYKKEDITAWGELGCGLDERLIYFRDPVFVRDMPVLPKAREFIQALSRRAEIFIATSVAAECAGERVSSIIRNFPEINPENILIGTRKDMLKADMLLDDCPDHIRSAEVTYPVLFRQPWNLSVSGVISTTTYREFLTLVDMVQKPEPEMDPMSPVVLVGPSGAGKNRVATALEETGRYRRVMGYTTNAGSRAFYRCVSWEQFHYKRNDFVETSSYMGEMYGTCREDVESVFREGRIPLLVMDINGAVNMRLEYGARIIFVSAGKEECIRDILSRGLPLEETIRRISSIDGEMKNEMLCDMTVSGTGFRVSSLEKTP